MNRNFEKKVVLTSQNPEAFLTFGYDGSIRWIDVSANIPSGTLYVNGWDINLSADFKLKLNATTTVAPFHLYTKNNEGFTYDLHFDVYEADASTFVETIDVSIINKPFIFGSQEFNSYETYEPLVDGEASYLLLRTNPKYTGNIKLMIDPSNNMFLDTFKVSEILSNKKYRKQAISGNSFLSGDVRRVFSTLPVGEIYRVDDEDTLDISNPKTEYSDQYNVTYNYGASLLKDELYEEDYSILAPLWVNSKIPDYFAVFRLDGTYNDETYNAIPDLSNLAVDFLKDGELFKSWNLKDNAPVGIYLNNHLNELSKVEAPVNLSLNEYDPNTWYGIAVDKGIITGRSEVPYFFEKVTNNFTNTNAFVSQGFERQNLLCPNLLNLEYTFYDHDVSLYSMHRYFGLYLTENELYKVAYYSDMSTGENVQVISLDGNDSSIFIDSSIFYASGDVKSVYENRLFVLNDGNSLNRITNSNQIDGSRNQIDEYVNKLGKNIFSTEVFEKTINSFVTFKINNLLGQGEHLRIISKSLNKIWEIYGSANDLYNAGDSGKYVSYYESDGYPTIYKTLFSVKGTIKDQIMAIHSAFSLFSDYSGIPFSVGVRKDDSLSIFINSQYDITNGFLFQRLTAQTVDDIDDPSSAFNAAAGYDDIDFYGILTPDVSDFNRISFDASFGPINFELYGDRMSLMINFVDPSGYYVYSFDTSISELFTDNVLYPAIDNWNRLIQEFDISTGVVYKSLYVEDPTTITENAIIFSENEISLNSDNVWDAYDVFPLSISIMGINSVKDIDVTVYDSGTYGMDFTSAYWYKRENDTSTYECFLLAGEGKTCNQPGSFEIISGSGFLRVDGSVQIYNAPFLFNTFFNNVYIQSTTDSRIAYSSIDGSHNFDSYSPGISEENIDDYYVDSSTKKKLKYGLTIPTISKWGTVGKDCRNNDIRLNLTTDFFGTTTNSNFIPYSIYYNDELSYPIFKYLDPGDANWEDYVYYDIHDIVLDSSSNVTIKELIFNKPYTDVFSKIVYSNNEVTGRNSRSSIFKYDIYKDEISTIIKGIKLGMKITSSGQKLLNIQNWNKFRFSFISSPSRNRDNNFPIEVIVNENTNTILMIWYQGNDILNYSKRYSSYVSGKSNLIDDNSIGNENYYGFLTGDPSYSYTKVPFIVNTVAMATSITNIYDNENSYDSSVCTPFAQFNWNDVNRLNSIFNAYGTNSVTSSVFSFTDSFDTFDQATIDYSYFPDSISYGLNITNLPYRYSNNYNFYRDNTCNLRIFENIIGLNNIKYYIIQKDSLITNDNFSIPPVSITIYDPIRYQAPLGDSSIYTFNGGYEPIFNNVLNFSSNESADFSNILEKDFIFGNTNLQSYNMLDQYWFNKVVENVTDQDSSNNILFSSDHNPFKSLWDADYYVLSDSYTGATSDIDGYNSTLELSSLFGSKLISLPDELILDSWDNTNSKLSTTTDSYILEYNLSQTIIDLFTNNANFVDNWGGLPSVSDDIINGYIIKTILEYYNISISKIGVEVWSKPEVGDILLATYDSDITSKLNNIDSGLYYENNEYIYQIKFLMSENRSYYTKFTFNKK